MPEPSKPAIELLQDLDLDIARQINPQRLDSLIAKLEKSDISENRIPILRTMRTTPGRFRLEEILKKRRRPEIPEAPIIPQFEVEKISDLSKYAGLEKWFDYNQIFTVPDQTIGPFPLQDGTEIYYKFYRYLDDFKVFFPGDPLAAFIVPVRMNRVVRPNTRVSSLELVKGNVWIRADLMDPAAPKTNYIGLKISSGSLGLGGTYVIPGNTVQIPKISPIDISLNLDNSFQADQSENIGLDGKTSKFKPADNIKLKTLGGKLVLSESPTFQGKTFAWESNLKPKYATFFWDLEKKYMCLFMVPDNPNFVSVKSESDLYNIWGNCRIFRSLWMLPSRILQQNQSVEVAFNGLLSLQLMKGLSLNWIGVSSEEENATINQSQITILNGFFHLESQKTNFQNLHDRPTMWQKSVENDAKMEVDISFSPYNAVQILSQSSMSDSISALADTQFYIDKPLRANNEPVKPKSKKSIYIKMALKDSKQLWIVDTDLLTEDIVVNEYSTYGGNLPVEKYQFVLENAYFTTTKEVSLFLRSKFDDSNHLYDGNLQLMYGIYDLLPTLPHPYTTNRLYQDKRVNQLSGNLQATITWLPVEEITLAEVTFQMKNRFEGGERNTFEQDKNLLRRGEEEFEHTNSFMLFDVSTESDHWGVSLSFKNLEMLQKISQDKIIPTSDNVITINKNYLQAPMGLLNGLTLPQVSWEPVLNITLPLGPGDPNIGVVVQKNNAIPTVFSQVHSEYVKIHPADYLKTFQQNLRNRSEDLQSKILFTLPNGKYSVASLSPYTGENMCAEGHLDFIMPRFEFQNQRMKGGIQLRIASYKDANPDAPPRMKGKTVQMDSIINDSGAKILGETVTSIFNNVFSSNEGLPAVGVPITHIDFSGYGASTFSDWKNPLVKFASISQAKFNIFRGRTAHEIVQAVSVIYPWGISVTRTVTFLRNNNAIIFREDSGWVAKSEGFFDFSFNWINGDNTYRFDGPYNIYPGMIEGLYKITNIREDYSDVVKFSYNSKTGEYYLDKNLNLVVVNHVGMVDVEFVAVYFDADVKLDAIDQKVTGKHFKGYLQVKPEGIPIPSHILKRILDSSQNPISGNIEALLPVEKTLQKFKANAVEVSSSFQNNIKTDITFVGAVKGSVILPSDGSWSVVEVDNSSGTVQNIKTGTSVGLIKDGLRPKNNGHQYSSPATTTRLAFPDALKNNTTTFTKTYGLLQNTDTQKLLLKGVEYTKGQAESYTSDPALLADCWRLMNSKGPFPNLNDAITMENLPRTAMKLLPDGVQKVFNLKVPDDFGFDIIGKEGDPFRIYLKYNSIDKNGESTDKSVIDYITDSNSIEKWTNKMHNLTVAVDLAMFKPLMYISGDFGNGKKFSPSLELGSGPQLKLDKTLQKIYDILEFLNNLDPTQPAEAIKKGLKIAMSNSADSWEYKFKAEKEIPFIKFPFDPINYNSPTTPLKMDAFFRMGVYFNQPIKIPETIDQIKPSVGAFLELGADLRVMCVSLAAATIYAVGRAEVGLAADLNTPPTLRFKFGFGVELAVGLPVIGSVAVTYMVGVDMKLNSIELIVGAFIYFRGRVEIFGGIVTITIAIEAAGQIEKKNGSGPTNCVARCTFALDISIAFVININFTETWEETRSIS